jgi:hypothetical protein
MSKDSRTTDQMGYEALQQEALRGVVRAALKRAATRGLPGDHHFMITFKTKAPGVSGPPELLGQYPDEMKIVLQHQFWELAPGETFFSVTLKFGGQPKTLSIPYAAITEFWDPTVDYRLHFTPSEPASTPFSVLPAKPEPAPAPPASEKPGDAPKIVSLDQFRKK